MKVQDLLDDMKENLSNVSHNCATHMLKKIYKLDKDDVDKAELKEFFINFNQYQKYLNDHANVIYNIYESSNDAVYEELCKYFNEDPDNKYLFEHRLKRIANQEPTKYLTIEDVEMRNAAIYRVDDKIEVIEMSTYYKNHKEEASLEIEKLKKSLNLVKRAVGLV